MSPTDEEVEAVAPQWEAHHYPPPWEEEQDDTGAWMVVCHGYNDETPIVCGAYSAEWPLDEENARMLAAAPRLYDLLKALLGAIDYREGPDGKRSYAIMTSMPPAFHDARAAIEALDRVRGK